MNPKIIPFILITLSWFIRTFSTIQYKRNVLEKPLIWSDSFVMLLLTIFFISLLIAGLFLGFKAGGLWNIFILLVWYFLIYPTFLNKILKKIMNKLHI